MPVVNRNITDFVSFVARSVLTGMCVMLFFLHLPPIYYIGTVALFMFGYVSCVSTWPRRPGTIIKVKTPVEVGA